MVGLSYFCFEFSKSSTVHVFFLTINYGPKTGIEPVLPTLNVRLSPYDITSKATTVAVFLLGETGECYSHIDVLMLFGGYTEAHGDGAETIVFIKILCRHI